METSSETPKRFFERKSRVLILGFLLLAVIGPLVYFVAFHDGSEGTLLGREIAGLEEQVKQNPNNLDARVRLALLFFDTGSPEKAMDQLETALEKNETHQGALVALGDVYSALGRYEEAIEPYGKAVELIRGNPQHGVNKSLQGVQFYLGVAYVETGNFKQAVESLEEAISIDWTDADALYTLGRAYQGLGECDKAIESLSQAVRFVPEFPEAFERLAECYESTGQAHLVLYAEGMVSYASGDTSEAISQLQAAVVSGPDSADAYLGLGLALERDGQMELALMAYQNAIRIEPDMWLANAKLEALGAR